jgi:hypothetical protein
MKDLHHKHRPWWLKNTPALMMGPIRPVSAIKNWRVDVKTNAPGNLKALMLEPMPALV